MSDMCQVLASSCGLTFIGWLIWRPSQWLAGGLGILLVLTLCCRMWKDPESGILHLYHTYHFPMGKLYSACILCPSLRHHVTSDARWIVNWIEHTSTVYQPCLLWSLDKYFVYVFTLYVSEYEILFYALLAFFVLIKVDCIENLIYQVFIKL